MKANTPVTPTRTKHLRRGRSAVLPKLNGVAGGRVKSILVPVDFSPPSIKALDYSIALAAATKARLTLLNVLEIVFTPEFVGERMVLPTDDDMRRTRMELKRLAVEHGCTPGMMNDVNIRKGTPFHEITSAARALHADMIVIATHGYTGVKHVLLGSTAERVVRHATCPVLVVPARS